MPIYLFSDYTPNWWCFHDDLDNAEVELDCNRRRCCPFCLHCKEKSTKSYYQTTRKHYLFICSVCRHKMSRLFFAIVCTMLDDRFTLLTCFWNVKYFIFQKTGCVVPHNCTADGLSMGYLSEWHRYGRSHHFALLSNNFLSWAHQNVNERICGVSNCECELLLLYWKCQLSVRRTMDHLWNRRRQLKNHYRGRLLALFIHRQRCEVSLT